MSDNPMRMELDELLAHVAKDVEHGWFADGYRAGLEAAAKLCDARKTKHKEIFMHSSSEREMDIQLALEHEARETAAAIRAPMVTVAP